MVSFAGKKEAVFSSSEDRIRVGTIVVSGTSIGCETSAPHRTRLLIRRAAEGLFFVLFPSDCRICGFPLLNASRLPVCRECLESVHPIRGNVCSICGERVLSVYSRPDDDGLQRCPVCRRIDRPFERAIAYGSYDDSLRELIHLLKYNRVRPAANVLGRMLGNALALSDWSFGESAVLVVPVPLYKGKRRERGFNQSELIARAALKNYQAHPLQLAPDLLRRVRPTHSQIGLTSHQRRENLRGAFVVTRAEQVIGREIVLVDDVYTTGTTVTECARVLRKAGAAKVWVATVARTLKLASKYQELGTEEMAAVSDVDGARDTTFEIQELETLKS